MLLQALHSADFGGKKDLVAELEKVATEHRGSVLCMTVEEGGDNSGVFNFFGVKSDDVSYPLMYIVCQVELWLHFPGQKCCTTGSD